MFESEIEELQETYGEVATIVRGEMLYVRLSSVPLPLGCTPERTAVLLVLQGQNRPQVHVQPGIIGPHGGEPRSCTPVLVEGESWIQFSYNFPWDPARDGLVKFVATALTRFSKHE